MTTIQDFLLQIFILKLNRLVTWWYGITMKVSRILAPKYTYHPFVVRTPIEITQRISYSGHYREDPISGFLDVLSHPNVIQSKINKGVPLGDCDDHGIYWTTCLLVSNLAKEVWFSSIQYKRDGKNKGHVICVWRDKKDQLWWADYGVPRKIEYMWEWYDGYKLKPGVTVLGGLMVPVSEVDKRNMPVFGKDILTVVE